MTKILKLGLFSTVKEHPLIYDWSEDGKEISIQGGDEGIVLSSVGNYTTAFFEAFPDKPRCFIRGEGENIAKAEEDAWNKYQKILVCNHEMERRDRTDGYAYCKHCSYSATVFEPLTHCCKCGVKTAYSKDFRGNYYCKQHSINKPKDPNPDTLERMVRRMKKRLPRKFKKQYKQMFETRLYLEKNISGERITLKKGRYRLVCAGFSIDPFLISQIKKAIRAVAKFKVHKSKDK